VSPVRFRAQPPLPMLLQFLSGARRILAGIVLIAAAGTAFAGRQGPFDLSALQTPIYTVEGDAFVRHNGGSYCNRSLYCNHIYAAAFGGDRPYVELGSAKAILGNMMFALVRNGRGTWLQNASDITSKYRPGRMEWIIKDAGWGGTIIHLEAVPAANGPGVATHIRAENTLAGDTLVWASGEAHAIRQNILWEYDVTSQKTDLMQRGFVPADCEGNVATVNGASWTLQAADGKSPLTTGSCSEAATMVIADASKWQEPVSLLGSTAAAEPIACGSLSLASNQDLYWSLLGKGAEENRSPAEVFAAGMQREQEIENQVVVNTPDPWLNAAVGASANVTDAVFRDGIYTHSGMRWAKALLGWRTVFGGTVFGSHDNVKTDARIFISKQIKDSPNTTAKADPNAELSSQAPDSRMFGKGRIDFDDPHHYDMQSQFFDQIEHAWQWTGDSDLENLLRPALELHCEYIKDCFDPAGLGIYESYANTWPTDDQWYNGGGTSEETAYAYHAEETALRLAQRAGDQQAIQLHAAAVERIRDAFFNLLWIPERGHPGAYREQAGLKRLHESGWLYAIFCPIDAGLLSTEQAAESLQYTETSLERVKLPYGGEQCWPSNWVPSIWSVREMWSGDNYQLALAYFQTGLADDGYKILHGTFPQQMLFGPVPGDMGHPAGGTDFNDCNSMFARAVVEGLFGYRPNYPGGKVTFAPQFPSDWNQASITTPDMSMTYARSGNTTNFKLTLAKASPVDIQLPVSTQSIQSVAVNGTPAKWYSVPGFGQSLVKVDIPSTASATIAVTCQDEKRTYPAIHIAGNTGDGVTLQATDGQITAFHDPEGVLTNAALNNEAIKGELSANAGDHVVFALTRLGSTDQWRMFKIHVADVKANEAMAAKTEVSVPKDARWDQIPMQPALNGDIRIIYKQQYLSPRPNTCSLRLATDGYSSWQMILAKNHAPPEITLDNIGTLSDGHGNIVGGGGIPFQWPAGPKNIAFTSRWDNWPQQINVPVNKSGDAIFFLLCGTTNPMEVRIANAELRMIYADGVVEKLPIVPPFNFWTLCPFDGIDYDYARDGFSLPKTPPSTVQLGKNCRGIVLGWRLRPGVALKNVTLEAQSEEVVIGLMGLTVMSRMLP
jgi:hypothetical protein